MINPIKLARIKKLFTTQPGRLTLAALGGATVGTYGARKFRQHVVQRWADPQGYAAYDEALRARKEGEPQIPRGFQRRYFTDNAR